MQPVIFGTAGHIDHGKTALVKALTGTDTDRLKEEKERGITIELGYAFLNERIAFIDVPGHERFIKNMVAGVATVDFAVLVIAADDGIMPQTREHFDILQLLGISDGVVVITKSDLVDDDWLDLVEEEIKELTASSFLEGSAVVRVDSLSGRGIQDLLQTIEILAKGKRNPASSSIFRLPIDRILKVKGFGTVVTGSALSGTVTLEDRLELLPHQRPVRVRGIESQGKTVSTAGAGMRVALNLSQIAADEVARGDVIATIERLKPTFMLDVELQIIKSSPVPLEQRQRIRLHLGTKEVMARAIILEDEKVRPGESAFVQLRLEAATAVQRLDRFVIRRYSPQITIGGGRILDANPKKHRKRHSAKILDALEQLRDDRVSKLLSSILNKEHFLTFDDLVAQAGLDGTQVDDELGACCLTGEAIEFFAKGKRYAYSGAFFQQFETSVTNILGDFHQQHPLRQGPKRGEVLGRFKKDIPDFLQKHFMDRLLAEDVIKTAGEDIIALHDFEVSLTKRQKHALTQLTKHLENGLFHPPSVDELAKHAGIEEKGIRPLLQLLVDTGKAINLEGKLYFHTQAVNDGIERLRVTFQTQEEISMSQFRELVDTSRKFALPLLNYYDNKGFTVRRGDVRVVGPKLNQTS